MIIGLSALSFSYRCGLIGRGTPRYVSQPLGVEGLIALAARAGLQSLEFPLAMLPDRSPVALAALRERLAECDLTPIAEADVADPQALAWQIPTAAALGAPTLRVLVSPVLEGARHTLGRPWGDQLAEVTATLRGALPLAERHGVTLAVENHQDATSADLIRLCAELDSPLVGVTFDPVNALAVAETPLDALAALGSRIRNVHLSDYVSYPSPRGYRLVRCALGEGEMNFRQIFELLGQVAPHATCQIDLVAQSSRHIQLLSDEWWEGYGPHDVRALLPVLRLMAASGHPAHDDWRTPWERGANEANVAFYEDQQFASSVAYLRTIGILPRIEG